MAAEIAEQRNTRQKLEAKTAPPLRVLFLTQTLSFGGAERQMVTLAKELHARGHHVVVAVFYPNGPLEPDLREAGVPIALLEKRHRWDVWGFGTHLTRLIRRERPDVLHGYLQVPNLLCALLKPLFPRVRVVWGVRGAFVDMRDYDRFVRLTYRIEPKVARFADRIIANSKAGRDWVVTQGFPAAKMAVIPNGIDTDRFRPNADERAQIRTEWNISPDDVLIGIVGRLVPIKDHSTFLQAAAHLARKYETVRFVVVGEGPDAAFVDRLKAQANELGLKDRLRWAGAHKAMPAVYNALDILCLSSYGEGFPNVIGEAMASGVPCVTTDAGDAAWIVGESGIVVPPRDPDALAAALAEMLARDRRTLAGETRQRIVEAFSVAHLADETEKVLRG